MNANNVMSLANAAGVAAKSTRRPDVRGKAGSQMMGSRGKAFGDVFEKSQGNDSASPAQDVKELASAVEDMAKEFSASRNEIGNENKGTVGRESSDNDTVREEPEEHVPDFQKEDISPVDVEEAAAAIVAGWGGRSVLAVPLMNSAPDAVQGRAVQGPDLQSLLPRSDEQNSRSQQMLAMLSGQMLKGTEQKSPQPAGSSTPLQGTLPFGQAIQPTAIPGTVQRVPSEPLSAQHVQMAGEFMGGSGQQMEVLQENALVSQLTGSSTPAGLNDEELVVQTGREMANVVPLSQETQGKGLLDGVRVVVEDAVQEDIQAKLPKMSQAQQGQPLMQEAQQSSTADVRQPLVQEAQQSSTADVRQPLVQEAQQSSTADVRQPLVQEAQQSSTADVRQPLVQEAQQSSTADVRQPLVQEAQQSSTADVRQPLVQEAQQSSTTDVRQPLMQEAWQQGKPVGDAQQKEPRSADVQEQRQSVQGIQQQGRPAFDGQQGELFGGDSQPGSRQQGIPVPQSRVDPMVFEGQAVPEVEFGMEEMSQEELAGNRTTASHTGENLQAGNVFQQAVQNTATQARADTVPAQAHEDFNIPQQIVEQARLIRAQESTEMVIHLKPEHLGNLTLRVSVGHNGAVTASFYTDNAQVRSIVENSLVQLRQELENQGIKVDKAEVYAGLSDGQLPQEQGQQAWQQSQGQGGSQTSFRSLQADRNSFEEAAAELSGAVDDAEVGDEVDGVDYRV